MTGAAKIEDEGGKTGDQKGRMRLAGRAKVLLNPEMDPERALFEPAAAAQCETGGFSDFGNAEKIAIEGACFVFAPSCIASWT